MNPHGLSRKLNTNHVNERLGKQVVANGAQKSVSMARNWHARSEVDFPGKAPSDENNCTSAEQLRINTLFYLIVTRLRINADGRKRTFELKDR